MHVDLYEIQVQLQDDQSFIIFKTCLFIKVLCQDWAIFKIYIMHSYIYDCRQSSVKRHNFDQAASNMVDIQGMISS